MFSDRGHVTADAVPLALLQIFDFLRDVFPNHFLDAAFPESANLVLKPRVVSAFVQI
jgi:hypothetical protein